MKTFLRAWLRPRNPKGTTIRNKCKRPLALEGLENRTVPSITLPTPGTPGPATLTGTAGNDQLIVQLQPSDPTQIQFSDDGGQHFATAALADVTSIAINGLDGRDRIVIDNSNGLVAKAGGLTLTVDGGPGRDHLVLQGDPHGPTITETYTIGATADAGTLTNVTSTAAQTINFSSIKDITDLTPANLTVNLDDQANLVRIRNDRPIGGVTTNQIEGINGHGEDDAVDGNPDDDFHHGGGDDSGGGDDHHHGGGDDGDGHGGGGSGGGHSGAQFAPITFANKPSVTVNTLGGDDTIVVSNSRPAAGLTTLVVDGGAGNDRAFTRELSPSVTVTFPNVETVVRDADDDVLVEEMFHSRLGRDASENEVEAFRQEIEQHDDRAAVVAAIDQSIEGLTRTVDSWYANFLGRSASAAEDRAWANVMEHGVTQEQAMNAILSSQEFHHHADDLFTTGTQTDHYVEALYSMLLNRSASDQELAAWANVVTSGGDAAGSFLHSHEYRGNVVESFYAELLHRGADDQGLQAWVSSNLSLGQVRVQFEASEEFFHHG